MRGYGQPVFVTHDVQRMHTVVRLPYQCNQCSIRHVTHAEVRDYRTSSRGNDMAHATIQQRRAAYQAGMNTATRDQYDDDVTYNYCDDDTCACNTDAEQYAADYANSIDTDSRGAWLDVYKSFLRGLRGA